MTGRPLHTLEEDELILLVQEQGAGCEEAFTRLVRCHRRWVVRQLSTLLGNGHDAEELTQEAFLRAFLALKFFRRQSSFRTWLRTIVLRLAYNHQRDRRTRDGYHHQFQRAGAQVTPNFFSRLAARESLRKTLAAISCANREILALRHLEQLSLDEIARSLDIGLSAAKMRLARAQEAFTEAYQDQRAGTACPPPPLPARSPGA